MAGVTCAGCSTHITVRGLDTCPICQAPVTPIPDDRLKPLNPVRAAATPAPTPATQPAATVKAPGMGGSEIVGAIVIAIVVVVVASIAWAMRSPPQDNTRNQAISKALVACQYAIHSTAQFGGADMPPYTKNYARSQDDEFYFAWGPGSFEFPNAFGARVKMSASCIGKLSTGEIKYLTINGKDIL